MMDLQPEMQDILRRNGMQAHVVSDGTGYRLVVQGHATSGVSICGGSADSCSIRDHPLSLNGGTGA